MALDKLDRLNHLRVRGGNWGADVGAKAQSCEHEATHSQHGQNDLSGQQVDWAAYRWGLVGSD